jgi:hypothetical protein
MHLDIHYSLRPRKDVVLVMNLDKHLSRFIAKTISFWDGECMSKYIVEIIYLERSKRLFFLECLHNR